MPTYRRVVATLIAFAVASGAACVHLPLEDRAEWRRRQYLLNSPEVSPTIADAVQRGHVVLGMTEAQVRATLGAPSYVKVFESKSQSPTAVWLYRGHLLHQDQLRTDAKSLFRIVFIDHRVAVIEGV